MTSLLLVKCMYSHSEICSWSIDNNNKQWFLTSNSLFNKFICLCRDREKFSIHICHSGRPTPRGRADTVLLAANNTSAGFAAVSTYYCCYSNQQHRRSSYSGIPILRHLCAWVAPEYERNGATARAVGRSQICGRRDASV